MKTFYEQHETKPKDLDNNYEAQQLNEYLNSDTEWKQVSDSIDDPEVKHQPNPIFLKMLKQRGR